MLAALHCKKAGAAAGVRRGAAWIMPCYFTISAPILQMAAS
jgi:hypothetical protein